MDEIRPDNTEPLTQVEFERISRVTATDMDIHTFCRIRKCRRDGCCTGPMRKRIVPASIARGPTFATLLPACMAAADNAWLVAFAKHLRVLHASAMSGRRPNTPPNQKNLRRSRRSGSWAENP
ncbi:hypothetical protein JNB71_02175 [Rhizobium herbae]|uniref:Transposase n=1 Tax=Rhizobium herbae TaxID=508661 RepID=A0ABS7H6N2_9HYPH|nr:hypothetical protein [Rhizobium herbae]MBW9062114.1 hypothetical protein [Rhizobium herbae]